jgi:hypothetical protein
MNEIVNLLKQMLHNGTIRIEINVSYVDVRMTKLQGGGVKAQCPDCGWTKVYYDERSATNALNGHRAQCKGYSDSKSDIPDWLRNSSQQNSE